MASIGNELKDSFKETHNWVSNNLSFLTEVEQFYRQRSALEKEYASKLNTLTSEFLKRKANKTTSISVGDEPKITPGSLESASMVTWNEILTQTENISKVHLGVSNELNLKICDQVLALQNHLTTYKTRLENYHDNSLLKSRDEFFEAVNKAKKHYDETCQAMETSRSKAEKSDRHASKLKQREDEMNVAKNEYLLTINVANRIKDKFFFQDLPEILDLYQDINEFKTKRLNALWDQAASLEINKNNRDIKHLQATQEVIKANAFTLDTQMFIKHNLVDWKEMQDFYYVPSSIWHDDDAFVCGPNEMLELKKTLKFAIEADEKSTTRVDSDKETLSSLANAKTNCKNATDSEFELKKALECLSSYLLTLSSFVTDENKKVKAQVEIETIENNTQGKDLSLDGLTITTKKAGFFGKLRGNAIKKKQTVITDSHYNGAADDYDAQSMVSSQHSTKTSSSSHNFKLSSLLRSKSTKSTKSHAPAESYITVLQGTALYAYSAQGSDEVSMSPGEKFSIDQQDDGSGWTGILKSSGEKGLVPTSYLSVESIQTKSSSSSGAPPPAVPAPRNAKKKATRYLLVNYDYQAEEEGELTIQEGDKVEVVEQDDGSGWTKGKLDGQVGLFPSSYAEEA